MDSNKKSYGRARTPSHNASLFVSKSSASKRFTPTSRGMHLNDTVCTSNTCTTADRSELPKMKTAISSASTSTQSLETECDLAYNDYLLALIKQEIVVKEVEKQRIILNGQVKLQQENLEKRNSVHEDIKNKIELLKRQNDIIMMMDSVRENLETLKTLYTAYQTDHQIEKISKLLTSECDKIILKNVKPLSNQDEYDKLFKVLRNLQATLLKIIKSGRDFKRIHNLAEDIKTSMRHVEQIRETRTELSNLEKDGLNDILRDLSDMFAKQYIDQ